MSGLDDARDLMEAVGGYTTPQRPGRPTSQTRPAKNAVVDPAYTGIGFPRVTFDGESVLSLKGYPFLGTPPLPSSRVTLFPIGHGYVIGGTIGQGRRTGLVPIAPTSVTTSLGTATVNADGSVAVTGGNSVVFNGVVTGKGRRLLMLIDCATTVTEYMYAGLTTAGALIGGANWHGGIQYRQLGSLGVLFNSETAATPPIGYISSGTSSDIALEFTGLAPGTTFARVHTRANYNASQLTTLIGDYGLAPGAAMTPDGVYLTHNGAWSGTVEFYEYVRL